MFENLRSGRKSQLVLGLIMGIFFGFFLQKGGVTDYNVIIGQLLLQDFTVVKVMLAAVVIGMPGVYLMHSLGWVKLHVKTGSVGATVIGGLIFGAGFAVLGYCPGTVAGAVGQGAMDALFGGVVGIIIGSGIFAALYPRLEEKILHYGEFPSKTIPEMIGVGPWWVVIPVEVVLIGILYFFEISGL